MRSICTPKIIRYLQVLAALIIASFSFKDYKMKKLLPENSIYYTTLQGLKIFLKNKNSWLNIIESD
jgi:hypothetical protein